MEKTTLILKDVSKSFKWGSIIGGSALVGLFLIIFLCTGFKMEITLITLRSIFLFAGAICLFVFSGFMIKNTFTEAMDNKQEWRRYYKVVSPTTVLLVIAITILSIGLIIDYIIIL